MKGTEAPSSISWIAAATCPSPTPSSLAMMRAMSAMMRGSTPAISDFLELMRLGNEG
jgi:hypothetical protein